MILDPRWVGLLNIFPFKPLVLPLDSETGETLDEVRLGSRENTMDKATNTKTTNTQEKTNTLLRKFLFLSIKISKNSNNLEF